MDYRQLFSSHIWARGKTYFENNQVEIVASNKEFCVAEVEGSDIYQVEIFFHNGVVNDMYCDCPYACDGNNCKHMAAVLMEIDYQKNKSMTNTSRQPKQNSTDKWKSIIDKYRQYGIQNHYKMQAMDRDFRIALIMLHNDTLRDKDYNQGLSSLAKALQAMDQVDEKFLSSSMEAIRLFLQALYDIQQNLVIQWTKNTIDMVHRHDAKKILISFAYPLSQIGLTTLQKDMEKKIRKKDFSTVSLLLKKYIDMMVALNYQDEVILNAIKPYHNFEVAISYEINYYIRQEQYEKAEAKINGVLKMPSLIERKKKEYYDLLGTIWLNSNNRDKYKTYAISKLEGALHTNAAFPLKQLRDMYKEDEWKCAFREISKELLKMVPYQSLIKIYDNMDEHEALMDLLYKRLDLSAFLEYQEQLKAYDLHTYIYIFYEMIITLIPECSTRYDEDQICEALQEVDTSYRLQLTKEVIIYVMEHYPKKKGLLNGLMELCIGGGVG